jgi:hypothetical protein
VRNVIADDLVVGAAEAFGQGPLPGQVRRAGPGQAVAGGDMDSEQVGALGPSGDAGGAADQRVTFGAAGQRDHHPLAGLPGTGDAMVGAVAFQLLVDLASDPQQGQFPQRGQVADPEVMGQRRIDLLGRVDVAVRHPAAQRVGSHVDQLDLISAAHHLIGHGLALRDAGNLLHYVVERFQMLDVHVRDHCDPGTEDLLDVLPPLGIPRAGDVGVRQLVDQHHLRAAGHHRVHIQLGERRAPVGDRLTRDDLQPLQQRGGERPPVGLRVADHHVGAPPGPPTRLTEHGVSLDHTRRSTEVNAQLPAVRHH